MTKDGNLLMYENKGRPTKAETESIKLNGDLKKELSLLKKKKYSDGTDILLAVSICFRKNDPCVSHVSRGDTLGRHV